MFIGPPKSLRRREADLRAAGFSKAEAREWLRRPPCKYGGPLVGLNRAVMFTYIERVTEVSDAAGGAGREDAEADKK
jgi:hypothetical protein